MKIDSIGFNQTGITGTTGKDSESRTSFADILKNMLNEVQTLQTDAESKTQALLAGDTQQIHQVMIASEKAYLALQLTLEIRNKLVEAYQEIMRIQV